MCTPAAFAALLLSTSLHVSGQTLYGVPTPGGLLVPESTRSISVGGVGADGATTYVDVGVYPTFAASSPIVFSTGTPISYTVTFVEGASEFHETGTFLGAPDVESCTFSADGEVACVNVAQVPDGVAMVTSTTERFSGSVVPIFTLGAGRNPTSGSAPSGTSPPSSSLSATPISPSSSDGVLLKTHTPFGFTFLVGVLFGLLVL
ncbi:hypothetical protein B0H16DRAFT_1687662 [Mycena metata]|uniref:Uncharacterized protein n=1 Tax=Mycena metata TaxID=1033252 RepID=A0AAD7NKE3_9AGAR|nr:hypothetical protein B0H16DRAFT_1687662 [Mycena metata]